MESRLKSNKFVENYPRDVTMRQAYRQSQKQPHRWFQIRHDLYKHVQARVRQRVGPESRELKGYRLSLEKDFSKKWVACEVEELFRKVNKADIIFMSDFHALRQSQRTHLRILKRVSPSRSSVLAVECVEATHQKVIDLFLKGKITEKEFLKKVQWQENWGFPWKNYQPLFKLAQQKKIPIVAINKNSRRLRDRDLFAAKKIAQIEKKFPKSRIFVIYGDLHLASAYLPKMVETRGKKTLRILQNSEKIYFQILKQHGGKEIEVVRLAKDSYCVLNVPPWVKWQNYLMFLEETYDQDLDENLDFTDHVLAFSKMLSRELDLKVSLSDLSVYSAKDKNFWDKIEGVCTKAEELCIAGLIDEENHFYLPGAGLGYLARGSVNQAAGLAMEYILYKVAGTKKNLLSPKDDFERWIWIRGWAYFGSKLINPKRKTDTLLDIKARLTSRKGLPDREPLQLALSQKLYELIAASQGRSPRKFKPRKAISYIIAADLLGGLMGERVYEAYRRQRLSVLDIQKFLSTDVEHNDFLASYLEFIKFIEKIPLSFKSKEEKI
jgi:hypothetical protein